MIKKISKVIDVVDKYLYYVLDKVTIVCYSAMVLAVLLGVILRFIFKVPNPYGEEISRYAMVLSVFLGIGLVERKNEQISVDFVVGFLPKKVQYYVSMLARLLVIVAYIGAVVISSKYVAKVAAAGQVSTSMRLPMAIVYAFLMVGFILAAFYTIVHFWRTYVDPPEKSEADDLLFYN